MEDIYFCIGDYYESGAYHSDFHFRWLLGKPSLKKKKKDDICHLRGGGGVKNFQNVIFLKVVFKIHFKLF